jgi:hypothetical protein
MLSGRKLWSFERREQRLCDGGRRSTLCSANTDDHAWTPSISAFETLLTTRCPYNSHWLCLLTAASTAGPRAANRRNTLGKANHADARHDDYPIWTYRWRLNNHPCQAFDLTCIKSHVEYWGSILQSDYQEGILVQGSNGEAQHLTSNKLEGAIRFTKFS